MRPAADCSLCPLCAGRTRIVLPSGNLDSKIAFVGEAPGENEDMEGKPFVGRAGKILDEIMLNAGLKREDFMITNTVKCRPPNNRDPTDEEMRACRPFLEDELVNC
ncbi:MAG: uracil-DNA glycosylase, partial [Candidatus Methanomethylophilaceae archaeon]